MKRFLKWFNSFELKRRIFFVIMILYALVYIGVMIFPYCNEKISLPYLILVGAVTIAYVFQYLYVEITDHKEFKKKLFKED